MKKYIVAGSLVGINLLVGLGASSASALSCLPVADYLKDVVGKEEIVIFVGKSTEQIHEADYTAEVIAIEEVKQGYAEAQAFAYHEKSIDWGYFCNAGPGKEGEEALYVTSRDSNGKYVVYQRLSLSDPLVTTLEADLKKAEVSGEVMAFSKTDRMNQIMTTIVELLSEISLLLKEHLYWKSN